MPHTINTNSYPGFGSGSAAPTSGRNSNASVASHLTMNGNGLGHVNLAVPKPTMMVDWKNGPIVQFFGRENGQSIQALFTPERDITSYETLLIVQLQMMIMAVAAAGNHGMLSAIEPIEFIRANHMERHFTFKVAP